MSDVNLFVGPWIEWRSTTWCSWTGCISDSKSAT